MFFIYEVSTKGRIYTYILWCFHTRARQRQDNDKTNVEPVHFYYAFHTRSDKPGVKGIIEMHRFNFCLVVVLSLSCSGVKAPLDCLYYIGLGQAVPYQGLS